MTKKVLVTSRTFGKTDPVPVQMLHEAGCEVVPNPYGRVLSEKEITELIQDVDGVILGLDPMNARVLSKARRLKAISRYGVGYNNVDIEYATRRGILVTNTPGVNSLAVAEHTLGLLFAVCRNICVSDRGIRQGMWKQYPGLQVSGKVIGLVGTGQIGRHVAELARGLRMQVLCYDIYPDEDWAKSIGAVYVSFSDLITKSDFISLHIPRNEHTYHMISEEEIAQMKSSAVIINTSRGGVLDEDALVKALKNGQLRGAGLDVFEDEPLKDSPLQELESVVLTTHIGAHTQESMQNMGRLAAANLIESLEGKTPRFAINRLSEGGSESASAG